MAKLRREAFEWVRDLAYGQVPKLEIWGEGESWGQLSYSATFFPQYLGSGLGSFYVWLRQRSLVLDSLLSFSQPNLHP